ncbi:MAG: hypothetical protein DRQ63_12935, partial [Gammaproteobacteria bacterium]
MPRNYSVVRLLVLILAKEKSVKILIGIGKITALLAVLSGGLLALNLAVADDSADLAKAAQNPISSMISVPFQWNTNLEVGPQDKPQHILNIQPVYPLKLNDDWN